MESRRQQLHNNVSKIRAALGRDVLPTAPDGLYSVGPGVTTDLGIFKRRAAAGMRLLGCDAARALRRALELVSGPVFSYRSPDRASFTWIDMEQWIFETEALVVDVAVRLVELYAAAGDKDGVAWAARRGFSVSPAHSGLTDALMEALIATGAHESAEEVYSSHPRRSSPWTLTTASSRSSGRDGSRHQSGEDETHQSIGDDSGVWDVGLPCEGVAFGDGDRAGDCVCASRARTHRGTRP
jgi:hypothetical protein